MDVRQTQHFVMPAPSQTSSSLRTQPTASVFVRTASRLHAALTFPVSPSTRVYLMDDAECGRFLHDITKKNVFLRIRRDNDFYYRRVKALAGHTVVEVTLPGSPKEILAQATVVADASEQLLLLAEGLATRRAAFHRLLGVSQHPIDQIGFVRSADGMTLRSATRPGAARSQVVLGSALAKRFSKFGFPALFQACCENTSLARRLRLATNWLVESRCEARFEAAVVKTSIALESLLIFSDRESLARSLSERMAFLISTDAGMRSEVSSAIKRFYDVRSGVVHGGKRRRAATDDLLDGVDRLIVFAMLKVAANRGVFPTEETLQAWLDNERWKPPSELAQPFSATVARGALNLASTGAA